MKMAGCIEKMINIRKGSKKKMKKIKVYKWNIYIYIYILYRNLNYYRKTMKVAGNT